MNLKLYSNSHTLILLIQLQYKKILIIGTKYTVFSDLCQHVLMTGPNGSVIFQHKYNNIGWTE